MLTKIFQDLTEIDDLLELANGIAHDTNICVKELIQKAQPEYIDLIQLINKFVCDTVPQNDIYRKSHTVKEIILTNLLFGLLEEISDIKNKYEDIDLAEVIDNYDKSNIKLREAESYYNSITADCVDVYEALRHIEAMYTQLIHLQANIPSFRIKKRNQLINWLFNILGIISNFISGIFSQFFSK